MDMVATLLQSIFGTDFRSVTDSDAFHRAFFSKQLTISELGMVHEVVAKHSSLCIPAAITLKGDTSEPPFAIMAQLHGNEPAGLAGILLAMALSSAGLLKRDVVGFIGNTLAAKQYFEAYAAAPHAPQETRDCYRCGLADDGSLLPDMNRTPIDFMEREPTTHHLKRAQEIYTLAQNISGIADIHSARGTMVCYTDHSDDRHLKNTPIRAILTELAEAISAHASAQVTVKTFKGILAPLPNITCQVGIEAGKHESPSAPGVAASFTLSLLHTLGITEIAPYYQDENGVFDRYSVQPRITYADLNIEGTLQPGDMIYMARETDSGIEHHQYEEMEAVKKGQLIAVARPSGALLRAPYDFSGIFWSKSAALYDKDPAVGPWPVAAAALSSVKLCYPCNVSKMTISF